MVWPPCAITVFPSVEVWVRRWIAIKAIKFTSEHEEAPSCCHPWQRNQGAAAEVCVTQGVLKVKTKTKTRTDKKFQTQCVLKSRHDNDKDTQNKGRQVILHKDILGHDKLT